jgi:hypothetical protein
VSWQSLRILCNTLLLFFGCWRSIRASIFMWRIAVCGDFRSTDFVVLLLGNDWGVKGVPIVLAAMAALPTLPLHLLVAGADNAGPFREMARRLNIS